MNLSSIEKRKATILKKRELQQIRNDINKKKKSLITNESYVNFQTKNINEDQKKMVKKALSFIKAPFKYATQLKIKYKNVNNAVVQFKIEDINKTKLSIKKEVLDIRNYYKKQGINIKIEVNLKYMDGWKSGKITNIDDDINFYDAIEYNITQLDNNKIVTEQKYFNNYEFFIIQEPTRQVGNSSDNNNNCLYNCLNEAIDNLIWKNGNELKHFLKVPYNSKVDVLISIPLIEAKLKQKYKINVIGDVIYNSPINSNRVINLKVAYEHITLIQNKLTKNINKKTAYNEKIILLYNQKTFYGYDGKITFFVNNLMLSNIYSHKTKYIIIFKKNNNISFEEEYKTIIETANELKNASNGKINLYKTGNYINTSLKLFNDYNKNIDTEKINYLESSFIEKSTTGAIIFYKKYLGSAYEFDIISMYPSILKSNLLIPIKQGEFKFISSTEFNNFSLYPFGVYHCIISKSDNIHINNLFRFNPNNYYTHIDLKRAKELQLSINIIEDGQSNFLYYNSSKSIRANYLFNDFVDQLYKHKSNNIKSAKIILNSCWGVLCERRKQKHYMKNEDDFIISDNHNIISLKTINENTNQLIISNNDNIYKTEYARMKPFLLSQARYIISTIMEPYKEDIINAHTDGFYLPYLCPNLSLGDNIGNLKYKGYCDNYEVKNCNSRIGTFT